MLVLRMVTKNFFKEMVLEHSNERTSWKKASQTHKYMRHIYSCDHMLCNTAALIQRCTVSVWAHGWVNVSTQRKKNVSPECRYVWVRRICVYERCSLFNECFFKFRISEFSRNFFFYRPKIAIFFMIHKSNKSAHHFCL